MTWRKRFLGLAGIAISALATPCVAQQPAGDPSLMTIEPGIKDVIAAVATPAPKHPLRSARFSSEQTSRSGVSTTEVELQFERLGSGLLGVVTRSKLPNQGAMQQALSLCGMFDVIASVASSSSVETMAQIPIGRLFLLPFGMKITVAMDATTRLTALEVDPGVVCSPAPGTSFEFMMQTETQLQVRSKNAPKSAVVYTAKGRCETSPARPASLLHSRLRGEFLEVTCTSTNNLGKEIVRTYAFLIDSSLYLVLDTKSEITKFKYTLLDVEYQD